MTKQAVGKQGEELAAEYLRQRDCLMLERNYRCREGEIDIICEDGPALVFVEVKTRRCRTFGSPEEAVTRKKQETIRRVALHWLQERGGYRPELRFDVISVWLGDGAPALNHIRNAF